MHSAALINNDLLIDLGPDLIASGMRHNLRLNAIPYTLQTHPHGDHLNSITFFARARICQVREIATMCLHCSATTVNWIDRIMFEDIADVSFRHPAVQDRFALAITEVAPWQAFEVGPYYVQAEANHHMGSEAMLYAIEDTRSGDRLFHGTGTGPLQERTWPRLAGGHGYEIAYDGWVADTRGATHDRVDGADC